MANFIYNSARKLFSQGSLDWTGTSVQHPERVKNAAYVVGQKMETLNNVYVCIQAGTTEDSDTTWTAMQTANAASVKASSIDDGTTKWKYLHNSFKSYIIQAALVNTASGSSMQNYNPSLIVSSNDAIEFVPGTTRNMMNEFGFGSAESASSLIRSGGNPIVAELLNRTFVSATQACTAGNITFPAVPDTGNWGTNIEGLVIYAKPTWAGASTDGSDWPCLIWIDTLSGSVAMNIDPNGGDIVVQWNASGIFRL